MTLKYLFTAFLKDGGAPISQSIDDVSVVDSARSAFYDVAQHLDDVVHFSLTSLDGAQVYSVDLRDGSFRINGVAFTPCQSPYGPLPAGTKYRLVYFRQHQQDFNVGSRGQPEEVARRIAYHIGWEATTVDGRTAHQTIRIQ